MAPPKKGFSTKASTSRRYTNCPCYSYVRTMDLPSTRRSKNAGLRACCANGCETFGIPAHQVTDSDILTIRRLTEEAISPMRTGESGPAFIECLTYRWREHVGPGEDYEAGYREREQLLPWQENDQMKAVGEMLEAATRTNIDAEVEQEIAEAVQFAEDRFSPRRRSYLRMSLQSSDGSNPQRVLRYVDGLREGVQQEMVRDPRVSSGWTWTTIRRFKVRTRGLLQQFGCERVFTTPLRKTP